MTLPPSVASGSTATIYAAPGDGDPAQVTLVLMEVDTAAAYATATVNVGTEMTLDIPSGLTPTAPWVFRLHVWVNLLMNARAEQILRGLCIQR